MVIPSCSVDSFLGGEKGTPDGTGWGTWSQGDVAQPCLVIILSPLPPKTVAILASLLPCPYSVPQWGSIPEELSTCLGGVEGDPAGAHSQACPSCRRSSPSWLCPPRWPRASRSWTPIQAWGEHRQGPVPHPEMPKGDLSWEGVQVWKGVHNGRMTKLRVMSVPGGSVQVREGGQVWEGVWLREDVGEIEGAGGDGEGGGPAKCFQMGVRSCGSAGPTGVVSTGKP